MAETETRAGSEPLRQPPLEKKVLLLTPDKFAASLIPRRQLLENLVKENRPPGDPAMQSVTREIQIISARARVLHEDLSAPNLETVRERQKAIGAEFARLDQAGNRDYYIRQGLQIRLQALEKRAEFLKHGGPLIKTADRPRWKIKEGYSAPALPPDKWELLSPRLRSNPDANLKEQEEYEWYIRSLSSARQKEIRSLSEQIKPIRDEVRAVVCMPAYKEGANIYRTLMTYVNQTEMDGKPFDYRKVRFIVFENWPEGTAPDKTGKEVGRFLDQMRRKIPGLQIDHVRAVMNPKAKSIGNIRNLATAAIIDNTRKNRRNPSGDLIYISNDADMPENAIKPTYLARTIQEFDSHPRMDALAGKIDFPEHLMAQVPVQLATRRLWQFMDHLITRKWAREPFLVGRSSAMRLKMIAAVGNYDPADRAGEDVEIGNKIKWIRSWDKKTGKFDRERIKNGKFQENNRVRYVHGISLDSDPRRDFVRILGNERIRSQYSVFERDQRVRGKSGEELTQQAVEQGFGGFKRSLFELEAGDFYWDAKNGGPQKLAIFTRSMSLLGASWEIRNGKFKLTDTRKLEQGINLLRFRELHQENVEKWLGAKFKRVDVMRHGANNQVFAVTTEDGRQLVIRTSTQQDRDKFTSEAALFDKLRKAGLPVPQVVALDTTRKIIPGRVLSVTERLPGTSLPRSFEKENMSPELLKQLGEALRKIHHLAVDRGYGFIKTNGEGSYNRWDKFVLEPFDPTKFKKLTESGQINPADIDAAIAIGRSRAGVLANVPRRLLHGDFGMGNILHEGDRLTGIVDLENAKSGDPIWDIALFMIYEEARIGGSQGLKAFLEGYGKPNLLSDPNARERFNLYKLSNILYGLEWYSYQPGKTQNIAWLNSQLQLTLAELRAGSPPIIDSERFKAEKIGPISRVAIGEILRKRYKGAVDWFREFYQRQGVRADQEYILGAKIYRELMPEFNAALRIGDLASRNRLFQALKKDEKVATSGFSDQEIKRQIDRLADEYRTNPRSFDKIDPSNPAFRMLVFLRNRGKLSRYEGEYRNLPSEINFREIALDLAKKKRSLGQKMNILDEGGTMDVGLQQLAGSLSYNVPGLELRLASIAADDMAIQYRDCHRFPVDHRMADIHKLNQVFSGEKRTLIVSQAAYKFFWDPVGAIIQSANALENGGWAFLGDIRDKTSYKIFEMFRDENGNPIDPQRLFQYLNSLNLGYEFYTGMHTSMRDGEPRQVMTLAIRKTTDQDLRLPLFYAQKPNAGAGDWTSPLIYLAPKNPNDPRFSGFTRV